jgi:hypothetical protein
MEKNRSDFKKANLQAYTDSACEAMEEAFHGWEEAGEGDPLLLLKF